MALVTSRLDVLYVVRYFFPTNVLTHMDDDHMTQSIEHEQEFFSIMEVGVVSQWWGLPPHL